MCTRKMGTGKVRTRKNTYTKEKRTRKNAHTEKCPQGKMPTWKNNHAETYTHIVN